MLLCTLTLSFWDLAFCSLLAQVVCCSLLAAGSEGEVYTAHLHGHEELVCLKKPWLTGKEGLDDMLSEAALLMHLQQQDNKEHIVGLVGFCVNLPTVAVLLPYCNGGDLLHKLAAHRFMHALPLC